MCARRDVIRFCGSAYTLPRVPASLRPRPYTDTYYILDSPEPLASLGRAFLGHHPIEMVYSPYVLPASEWVLSVFHEKEGTVDGPHKDSRNYPTMASNHTTAPSTAFPLSRRAIQWRVIRTSVLPKVWACSRTFLERLVVAGDAERLEREAATLERALEHDGVSVRMVWTKDAAHDLLVMAACDE